MSKSNRSRVQMDRGALVHVHEVSDPVHARWVASNYTDMLPRPVWGFEEGDFDTGDDSVTDFHHHLRDDVEEWRGEGPRTCMVDADNKRGFVWVELATGQPHPNPKLERISSGRRVPRAMHLDEIDAQPVPGRRIL